MILSDGFLFFSVELTFLRRIWYLKICHGSLEDLIGLNILIQRKSS